MKTQINTSGTKVTGTADYDKLLRLARTNPKDKAVVAEFFAAHEKYGSEDEEARLAYHHLKYLDTSRRLRYEDAEDDRCSHLNALGDIYSYDKSPHYAFMCFTESLRIGPAQSDIYQKILPLQESMIPKPFAQKNEHSCMVSIITATLNRPKELKVAIESVVAQTFRDFELIVVNDSGGPEAEEVVKSFDDPRIRYIRKEESNGLNAVFNTALRMANGKYIGYLDDDDIFYPDHLETMVNALEGSKYSAAYSTTKGVRGSLNDGVFEPEGEAFLWDDDFSRQLLLSRIYMGNLSILKRRDVFCDVGLFYEKPFSGDWEMWLRIARKYDFLHVKKVTGEYRIKTNNITTVKRDQAYFGGAIITAFHGYERGLIAFAKHYLSVGETDKAKDAYSQLKADYELSFKTPELLDELLPMASEFGDSSFVVKLSRDYFKQEPRRCIKKLKQIKTIPMAVGMLMALPHAIAGKLKK